MSNVTTLPTPMKTLADRYRDAYQRSEQSHAEWIVAVLDMAETLHEARQRFNNNRAFSIWIAENELDFHSQNDRAALINMHAHRAITERVLQETTRTSLRYIWLEEIEPIVHYVVKNASEVDQAAQTDANASDEAAASESESAQSDATDVDDDSDPTESESEPHYDSDLKNPKRAALVALLGITAEEFVTFTTAYPYHRRTRYKADFKMLVKKKDISKKRLRALFQIGVAVVTQGKTPKLSNGKRFDARAFLHNVPKSVTDYVDLRQLYDRLELIEPVTQHADALIARGASAEELHEELSHMWHNKGSARPKRAKPVVEVAADDSKAHIKHEVKFCGDVIWPNNALKDVTYQDLNTGWQLVHHWTRHLEHATPQKPNEVAVQVQHLIQDIASASSISGLVAVMLMCMSAYNKVNGRKKEADMSDCVPPGLAR